MVSNPAYSSPDFLEYRPGLQNSGDLEGGTKNVSDTSEPGAADYSPSLNIPAPADADMVVKTVGLRLKINITAMNLGATTLNVSVKRDAVTLLTGAATIVGENLVYDDLIDANIVFGAKTYEIRLWADVGNIDLDEVWLYTSVGATKMAGWGKEILRIIRQGEMMVSAGMAKEGTGGNWNYRLMQTPTIAGLDDAQMLVDVLNPWVTQGKQLSVSGDLRVYVGGGTDGDLGYIRGIGVTSYKP